MSKNAPNLQNPPIAEPNGNKATLYYAIALVVLVIDQLTKEYFHKSYELYQSTPIIDGLFDFTLAFNHGAAFSFLANQGGWQKWFFAVLGVAVSTFIVAYLRKLPKNAKVLAFGLALVLGGAIGNVIDRMRFGYVVDFLHVHWHDIWHYPIFNVADIGVCMGVALILIDSFFLESKRLKVV
ncbi:signal peptidase II [Faucicola boevrei]|uniref:signal peptidase II n=1 Tax=Faucicola boevrei TaxID=346665 RepID=UPI00036B272F|nr:signal peptidase II [Moraxella boevrei]